MSTRWPNCSVPPRGCPVRAGRWTGRAWGRARERRGGDGVMSEAGRTCQRPGCGGTYEDVGGGELY
ncbi:hypothetical protein, partial [Streptomyces rochei]